MQSHVRTIRFNITQPPAPKYPRVTFLPLLQSKIMYSSRVSPAVAHIPPSELSLRVAYYEMSGPPLAYEKVFTVPK